MYSLKFKFNGYQNCIYVSSSTISARREVSRYSHVPQVRAFPYFLKKTRHHARACVTMRFHEMGVSTT